MKIRGVSPIIAVVVLIGLTVVLAGLLSSWAVSIITQSSQQDMCWVDTVYTISDASYNDSTGFISLRLKNSGKLAVYNFSIEADNGTTIVVVPALSPDASFSVGPGMSQYITVLADPAVYNITNIQTITVLASSCHGYSPKPIPANS